MSKRSEETFQANAICPSSSVAAHKDKGNDVRVQTYARKHLEECLREMGFGCPATPMFVVVRQTKNKSKGIQTQKTSISTKAARGKELKGTIEVGSRRDEVPNNPALAVSTNDRGQSD